jgi:hypothetical protein
MLWRGRRQSANVEDRRGSGGGLPMGLPMGRRGLAGGGLGAIIVLVLALLFGIDPSMLLQGVPTEQVGPGPSFQERAQPAPADDDQAGFVAVVLAETEDTWRQVFSRLGRQYQEPTLVLFSGQVQSACGFASAASGPFYCPGDRRIYLDMSFFEEMRRRFGAPGDFAQAYVIAHEVGHHVQNLLGIMPRVEAMRRQLSTGDANQLSVMVELQADCFAGVWAQRAQSAQILEAGDLEEALNAANAIGDDRLQRQAQGYVVPDSFTHGSSQQRMRWFKRGFQSGDIAACDTFSAGSL